MCVVSDSQNWTTRRLLSWIRGHLEERGVDAPRVSAEMLVSAAIGAERLRLYMEPDRVASQGERDILRDWIRRAGDHEPIQYLVGEAWFHGLRIEVDASTLIPRPSSETLVETAATLVSELGRPPRILEPCAGTGCVGIALLRLLDRPHRAAARMREADAAIQADLERLVLAVDERADPPGETGRTPATGGGDDESDPSTLRVFTGELATLVATELVPEAATLARRNLERHHLGDRAEVRVGSLFEPLAPDEQGTFDLVVANPPYVSDAEYAECPKNVRDFEPATALRGGADGLEVIRPLVARAANWLRPGGGIAIEMQYDHAEAARDVLGGAGFEGIEVRRDADDQERVISGRRPG